MKLVSIMIGFTLAAVMLATIGCGSSPKAANKPAARPASATSKDLTRDPTATHLHDLAGMLLLYHATNGQLPPTLADAIDEGAAKATVDPASGRPYLYTPRGTQPPGFPGRVIVYQAVPTSRSERWAILVNDGANDGRLITYVQRVPEKLLKAAK